MTQLQMICFKLDGFIIYIKVSFVTNQYCCLSFFCLDGLKCLPTLSSFVSPLVKPDHPGAGQAKNQVTCKEGGWKEGGEMLVAFCLQTGFRMSAGARELGCVCSLTLSRHSAVEALHCSLALHPG